MNTTPTNPKPPFPDRQNPDRLQSDRQNPDRQNPDRLQPISYADYQSGRLDRLTPDQRTTEQARLDGLTPEQRAQDEINWNYLTPEEQLHRTSGHLAYQWHGPGYVLQSQVLSNHPNNEEVWARSGYTAEEIAAKRTEISDSHEAINARTAEERTALDESINVKSKAQQQDRLQESNSPSNQPGRSARDTSPFSPSNYPANQPGRSERDTGPGQPSNYPANQPGRLDQDARSFHPGDNSPEAVKARQDAAARAQQPRQ